MLLLQMLCEIVFTTTRRNYYTGLLRSPPTSIREQLTSLLRECVALTNDRITSTQQVFNGLQQVLWDSLNEDGV